MTLVKRNIKLMEDRQAIKKYNSIRKGSLIRNMVFNLTFQEYLPFYNLPCFYCGTPGQISLDRLDSSFGYEKGNIVTCCGICDVMKGTLNQHDFIFQCKKIAKVSPDIIGQSKESYLVPVQKLLTQSIQDHEKEIIRDSLNRHNGNRNKVSQELKISTTTLWRKMKNYNILDCITF